MLIYVYSKNRSIKTYRTVTNDATARHGLQIFYTQIMVSNNYNSKMKLGCQVCLA